MLSSRRETILKSIVQQYISKARPVPSQSILSDFDQGISSATVRNEVAQLEQEGYIAHPHPSAGSIPLDKGYRFYVGSIGDVKLPLDEQRLVSHLFHQVEGEVDEWLDLAAALIARMVQNAALVTVPKSGTCHFKHLELVSLQDPLVLIIFILSGAKVRQQLVTFDQVMSQSELAAVANKLSSAYSGLTSSQILAKAVDLPPTEEKITDCLVRVMEAEDSREYEEPYLNGLHFTLNQPEFTQNRRAALTLMELIEQRSLVRSILPSNLSGKQVQVIIGDENKTEAIRYYSVVISRYGLPTEALGTICVIGLTRMPYARSIATVDYLSSVLSRLVGKLYGRDMPVDLNSRNKN